MSARPLAVDEWVMHHLSGEKGEVARRVFKITNLGVCLSGWGFVSNEDAADLIRVRVIYPRPTRKLTLSAGLEWMHSSVLSLCRHGAGWQVTMADGSSFIAEGATPLKAIIAARKALRVRT